MMKMIGKIIVILFTFLFLFFCSLVIFSIKWLVNNFANLSIDEILFHLLGPLEGTESGKIISYINYSLIPTIIISISIFIILFLIFKILKDKHYIIEIEFFKHNFNIYIKGNIINMIIKILTIFIMLFFVYKSLAKIDFFTYLKEQNTNSTFIEENYIDPRLIKLTFPSNKRNLIYIFVESLESSYFSKDLGGNSEYNLLKELTPLTNKYISFSNTDKFGGALNLVGTTWTSAAMSAQMTGIPLKIAAELSNDSSFSSYLPCAYSLGEILDKEGYNQMLMVGSNANFGNRRIFFETHGNYNIYDLDTAKEKEKIPSDYFVWWGFEDSKLYSYAKEEILNLANLDKPFNFTLLTSNTHATDGYLESECDNAYDEQLSNVIACSSKQLAEFIKWIQKQDFYKNTTIVIVGDHLNMNNTYFKGYDNYERTVYNLFINSLSSPSNTLNRQFTVLDLFPTTLASLGVSIEGDKLSLGTNLFSDEKTIIEKYGYEKVNNELKLKSTFYNNKFIYNFNS